MLCKIFRYPRTSEEQRAHLAALFAAATPATKQKMIAYGQAILEPILGKLYPKPAPPSPPPPDPDPKT